MKKDIKLKKFLELVASSEPIPGGGSASAVSSALGFALLAMSAGLCIRNVKKSKVSLAFLRTLASQRKILVKRPNLMLNLAYKDSQAYENFMSVLSKIRKGDLLPKRVRRFKRKALLEAANVPLMVLQLSTDGLISAKFLSEHVSKTFFSDLAVGVFLLHAGAQGAYQNVLINLMPRILSESTCTKLRKKADALVQKAEQIADKVKEKIKNL